MDREFAYQRAIDMDALSRAHGYFNGPNVDIPQEGGFSYTPTRWTLGVYEDPKLGWRYTVGIGLINGILSDAFDNDELTFEDDLPQWSQLQVGIKLDLTVDTNAAGYVMPTTASEALTNGAGSISFVIENYSDFEFSATNIPEAKNATGTAVIPLGRISKETVDNVTNFSVDFQTFTTDLYVIYSPFDGLAVFP